MKTHPHRWLRKLGPGVITGAADDDPSGIATYSQAGAQFGFALGWTVVLTLPLMIGIQMISARIGRVTGHGLASNIRRHYPAPVLYAVVALLFVANTINVAADIAAMAESVHLVAGGPTQLYAVAFGTVCLGLEVFMSYRKYVRYLKWLTLALFAYVGVVLSVDVPWGEVVAGIALPRMDLSAAAVTLVVAIFGTTISPYLFFWQAAQEVEDAASAASRRQARKRGFDRSPIAAHRIRYDRRHDLLEPDCVGDHRQRGSDAASGGHHPHRNLSAGSRSAAARSPDRSPSFCSAWASSARACWRCRCSPGPLRTPLPRPFAGSTASI